MPVADITIRPARAEDIASMCSLLTELFSIESDFCPNEAKQRRGLAMLMEDARGQMVVAEKEGRTVGMCTGQLVISTAEGGYSVLVEDLVVSKDCRKQGLASAMLEAIGHWASLNGAERLQLLADKDNDNALRFYERIGWRRTNLVCIRRKGH